MNSSETFFLLSVIFINFSHIFRRFIIFTAVFIAWIYNLFTYFIDKGHLHYLLYKQCGYEFPCLYLNSLDKTLMLGKIEGRKRRDDRGWDGWMMSLTQWTWAWANPGDSEGQESVACCSSWGHKELDTHMQKKWKESNTT